MKNSTSPTVSVIIPAYNEAERLEKCLTALQNQLVAPNEIILIDNNSTDKTVEIAKRFNVKILHEKRQGVIFARNLGFNTAHYDLLARTDADCIVPPDWIKKIKENFKKRKLDALGGPWYFHDISLPNLSTARFIFYLLKILHKHEILSGPNLIITKVVWNKIKDDVCLDISQVFDDIDLSIHINKVKGVIWHDKSLVVKASGRRMLRKPSSFFIDYSLLIFKGIQTHKKVS